MHIEGLRIALSLEKDKAHFHSLAQNKGHMPLECISKLPVLLVSREVDQICYPHSSTIIYHGLRFGGGTTVGFKLDPFVTLLGGKGEKSVRSKNR